MNNRLHLLMAGTASSNIQFEEVKLIGNIIIMIYHIYICSNTHMLSLHNFCNFIHAIWSTDFESKTTQSTNNMLTPTDAFMAQCLFDSSFRIIVICFVLKIRAGWQFLLLRFGDLLLIITTECSSFLRMTHKYL